MGRSKLQVLALCRNRCLAQASSDTAADISAPVLRLLFALLEHSGAISPEESEEYVVPDLPRCTLMRSRPRLKTRMRLKAAKCLLQLAAVETYRTSIAANMPLLALTFQVRVL